MKHAKSGNKEKSKPVWFLIEPKAGRKLEIFLPSTKSVGKPVVAI